MVKRILISLLLLSSSINFAGSSPAMATEWTQHSKLLQEMDKYKKQFDTYVQQNLTYEAQLQRLKVLSDEQIKKIFANEKDKFIRLSLTINNITKASQDIAKIEKVMTNTIDGYNTDILSYNLADSYKNAVNRNKQRLDDLINEEDIMARGNTIGDRIASITANIDKVESPTQVVQLLYDVVKNMNDTVRDMEVRYMDAETDKMLEKAYEKAKLEHHKKMIAEKNTKIQNNLTNLTNLSKQTVKYDYKKLRESYTKRK